MTDFEILRQGDPRIPKRMQRAIADSKPKPAVVRPSLDGEFPKGNPGYLDTSLGPDIHADSTAAALLEAQGAPVPEGLRYLSDNPDTLPEDHPLTPRQARRLAMNKGRSLMLPTEWSDSTLERYLKYLAPLALSASENSDYPDAVSPRVAPLLMGGIGFGMMEEMTERAMDLLRFEYEEVEPTLNYAMRLIGFGEQQPHLHADNVDLANMDIKGGESPEDHLERILASEPPPPQLHFESAKHGVARYYLRHTQGPFAAIVPQDAYRYELQRKVSRHKWWVVARTRQLFSPYSGEIPKAARDALGTPTQWLDHSNPGHAEFAKAVRLVFEQPWHELDLKGHIEADVPKVMARLLIHRLSRGARGSLKDPNNSAVSARALVGMSLLTGIPTPKFVRFAVNELRRRGESFLTPEIVRRAIQLVDESEVVFELVSSKWMEQMEHLAAQLEHYQHEPRANFAFILRGGSKPLTSTQGVYQITGYTDGDEPIYKPRLDPRLVGLHEEF